MTRPRILVLAIALTLSSATSFSTGLETRGQAPSTISPLGTYGMGVATRVGLKTVVPSAWKIFVHQSATLPETLDWSVGDTWVQALERLTAGADLSVLVDWEAKSVMFRTREIAVQEAATRQEIGQAALTPLPKFSHAVKPLVAAAPALAEAPISTPAVVVASAVALPAPIPVAPVVADTAQSELSPADSSTAAATPQPKTISGLLKDKGPVRAEPTVAAGTSAEVAFPALAPAVAVTGAVLAHNEPVKPAAAVELAPAAVLVQAPAPAADIVIESSAHVVTTAAPQLPAIRTNPTKEMVVTQAAAVAQRPVRLSSTQDFSYTQAVALNKPSAKKVVQAIANKYNLRVVWALQGDYPLRGPVTLLAQSATQDIGLLQKALGRAAGLVFEVSTNEGVIRAFNAGSPRPIAVVMDASASMGTQNGFTGVLGTMSGAGAQPEMAGTSPSDASQPVAAPVPVLVHLDILPNQPLEDALTKFARDQGYTLDWQIEGGFEATRGMAYDAPTLTQVLAQVLPPLGMSADVYTRDKHIVVRPSDARN